MVDFVSAIAVSSVPGTPTSRKIEPIAFTDTALVAPARASVRHVGVKARVSEIAWPYGDAFGCLPSPSLAPTAVVICNMAVLTDG
jgi:hypothetical protein